MFVEIGWYIYIFSELESINVLNTVTIQIINLGAPEVLRCLSIHSIDLRKVSSSPVFGYALKVKPTKKIK